MGGFDKEKLGALWCKESKNGKPYLSGFFGPINNQITIVAFQGNKRPGKRDPDYIIYKSEPPIPKEPKNEPFRETPIEDDDIPF